MNRRKFTVLAGCSSVSLCAAANFATPAFAGVPPEKANLLRTSLTPFGAQRSGNEDGSIPAWSGGLTNTASSWSEGQLHPDYFADDATLLTIDSNNLSQHSDLLSVGLIQMIGKYDGFKLKVYPSHRTSAAPQWVYDYTYQNALNSSLDPAGGRFGLSGAFGGIAFPILDDDPDVAGAQVIWNHLTRWDGANATAEFSVYNITGGSVSIGGIYVLKYYYPYYDQSLDVTNFGGWYQKIHLDFIAPAVLVGQVLCEWSPTNARLQPQQAWELLNGQGRVRKAPELTYDTPTSTGGGISNYDESFGFYGSPDRYNWKYIQKKEMYIPYNNNKLINAKASEVIGPQYLNPDYVRFEKHRVHIIDATLAPGERHSIPHRRLYVDEDNWHVVMVDEYDKGGNYIKHFMGMNTNVPELPGTIFAQQVISNLQTNQYEVGTGIFVSAENPGYSFAHIDKQIYNPQFIAASSQY